MGEAKRRKELMGKYYGVNINKPNSDFSQKFYENYWIDYYKQEWDGNALLLLNVVFSPLCTANEVSSVEAYKSYTDLVYKCLDSLDGEIEREKLLSNYVNKCLESEGSNPFSYHFIKLPWRQFKGFSPEQENDYTDLREYISQERLDKASDILRSDVYTLAYCSDTALSLTSAFAQFHSSSMGELFVNAWLLLIYASMFIVD